jgi:hypothetical protein
MSHNTYQLVNPVIQGTFNDVVDVVGNDTGAPIKAAKELWKRFTQHVSGHVPKFLFSLRNVENNRSHHFQAKERISDGSFTIKEILDIKVDTKDIDRFHANIDNIKETDITNKKQKGGRRKRYKKYNKRGRAIYYDDSSSSSDSESYSESDSDMQSGIEFNPMTTTPIAMFHYNTKFYHQRDGQIFEHESTANPEALLINHTPIIPVIVNPIVRSRHTFTSIPIFKRPLLPIITIW